jgi:hypothetical protein
MIVDDSERLDSHDAFPSLNFTLPGGHHHHLAGSFRPNATPFSWEVMISRYPSQSILPHPVDLVAKGLAQVVPTHRRRR